MTSTRRAALFAGYSVCLLAIHAKVMFALVEFARANPAASQTILVPFIALAMMYERRARIFASAHSFDNAGAAIATLGVVVATVALLLKQSADDVRLSAAVAGLLALWLGGFVFVYGRNAARAASFPLLFLAFMIPIPGVLLAPVTAFLKAGSAKTVAALFTVTGTPFHQNGFAFTLPKFTIEIADECSGIRSSIALMLTSLVGADLFLGKTRNKAFLAAAVVPIALLKNGIRIVALCLLASNVDPGFLAGQLHHEGGIAFFLLVLPIVTIIIVVLRRFERRSRPRTGTLLFSA